MKKLTEVRLKELLDEYKLTAFEGQISELIIEINEFKHYNKILICGNGGSSSDSQHVVGELMKNFTIQRKIDETVFDSYSKLFGHDELISKTQGTIRAISLTSETSLMTAISNDIGYDYVFSQQVYGYGDPGDILFAFSTSGNSQSIINACKIAKAKNIKVVGFTGENGGKMASIVDILFNVGYQDTFKVQQVHEILYHIICMILEYERF